MPCTKTNYYYDKLNCEGEKSSASPDMAARIPDKSCKSYYLRQPIFSFFRIGILFE